ncbi:MAG: NAD(P)H-dependent oxidoreductase [Candidatus Hydrogenedentes bacterium]|nr:NAD(P)H-dependent oxidoreductase [Candidatus Hydrogenedentota bacterium]
MSYTPRILAFAGSLRAESYNKKLIRIAASGAEAAGARVTLIDLSEYRLPIFDEDLEKADGMPVNGRKLKDLMLAHEGLLLACPEYNSSITAVLKNTIDWTSRAQNGEPALACYKGKTAVIMSASPGALGGLRGLVAVRSILGNIQVTVLPNQIAIAKANEAFGPDGNLLDEAKQKAVLGLGETLARTLAKLHA